MEDNSAEDEDDEAALLRALAMSKDNENEGVPLFKPAENKEAPKEETELKDVISMDFLKDIIQDMNLDVDKEGLAEVA